MVHGRLTLNEVGNDSVLINQSKSAGGNFIVIVVDERVAHLHSVATLKWTIIVNSGE